jgi:hypothetical protein
MVDEHQGVYEPGPVHGATMKFEVVQCADEWIVRREGVEVGRFEDQDAALNRVAAEMRGCAPEGAAASLAVRYQRRSA